MSDLKKNLTSGYCKVADPKSNHDHSARHLKSLVGAMKSHMQKATEKAPVEVSDPVIENHGTVTTPQVVNGPNPMSTIRDKSLQKCGHHLRRLIGSLKKVDPVTRLPGNLINKSNKVK
jgi:hypothetical protein